VAYRLKLLRPHTCRSRPGVLPTPGRLLVAAALVILAGCTEAPATVSRASSTAGYSTRDGSRQTPFIEATPPPAGPPAVELIGGVESGPMSGTLYTADWPTRATRLQKGPRLPVPWPATRHIGSPRSVILRFDARTPPDRVLVKAFSRVDPTSGEPTSDPAASYRCNRISDPRCSFERARSGVRLLGLPSGLLTPGYLVVFCTWFVPPGQPPQRGGADAAASWLFRVD
jgi:hypothetical protein